MAAGMGGQRAGVLWVVGRGSWSVECGVWWLWLVAGRIGKVGKKKRVVVDEGHRVIYAYFFLLLFYYLIIIFI